MSPKRKYTIKPPISGYLQYPDWLPTKTIPRRHVSWPTGLYYTAEYVSGEIEKVGVVLAGWGDVALTGWRVVSPKYLFQYDSSYQEKVDIFVYRCGDILCRAADHGTEIKAIIPPHPKRWGWKVKKERDGVKRSFGVRDF